MKPGMVSHGEANPIISTPGAKVPSSFRSATGRRPRLNLMFDHKLKFRTSNYCRSSQVRSPVFELKKALTNVARHSAATQVEIRVCEEADCLTLTISDDGKGIGADELMDRKSIGLAGMKERALAIGARFAIEGFAEKGTVVTIEVPL